MFTHFTQRILKVQAFRFLIIGGINTVVGLALFPTLFMYLPSLRENYLLLMTASQAICIGFAYLTNKYLVFRTKSRYLYETSSFLAFHGFHYIFNILVVAYFVETYAFSPLFVQPMYSLLVILSSYLWYSSMTFKKE
ncbi:MAG: GtrA family protein [Gammaproteobacteria bacterium]|nr:GtrA family protein [Gammaproteobacteria bacterium]